MNVFEFARSSEKVRVRFNGTTGLCKSKRMLILQIKIGPRVVALHSLELKVDALELKQSNIGIWFEN